MKLEADKLSLHPSSTISFLFAFHFILLTADFHLITHLCFAPFYGMLYFDLHLKFPYPFAFSWSLFCLGILCHSSV